MVLTAADTAMLARVATAVEGLLAAGVTVNGLEVDIADVDVAALIAGIAGTLGSAKTLEDLDTVLKDSDNADLNAGNILGDIKTAIEGVEDELDGTTTTGPLDVIRAVDEGRAIAASGQHLDNGGAGTAASTNYSVTVVESATYRVHAVNGVMYLGIADATSDANVLWIVGAGQTEIITIPSGTSLTYAVDTAGVEGRLARIQ